jgi:hypothetical protein
MDRLDRNDSLALMRILAHVERQVTGEALRVARIAIRNDRQYDEVHRALRAKATEAKNLCLRSCQDLGFVDKSITPDDLRNMR